MAAWWARVDRRRLAADLVFWGLVVAALVALVAPLWAGAIPPLTDFGGHLQMADAWVRLPDDAFIARFVERHDDPLMPNLLAVRFAALVHPLIDPMAALRLFTSLTMVGLAASILWLLASWRRSRWLVFLALPFTWNGMVALGLINYAAAIVLMLAGCALARRCAVIGRPRDGVLLGLVLALTFFAHALGPPLALAMAGCVLVVSARTRRRLAFLVAFVPAAALWVRWYLNSRSELGLSDAPVQRFTIGGAWDELLVNTIDVTHGATDMVVFTLLVGSWIVLLATSAPRIAAPSAPPPRVLGPAGAVIRAMWLEAREHALLLVGLGLLLGYFFIVPGYIGDTFIAPRLIVPAVLLLFMAPRVASERWLARAAIAAAVVCTFVFARDIGRHVDDFERRELAPLTTLIDAIPEGRRVLCAESFRVPTAFIRFPLDHGCNGLVAFATGGFADGGFANTPYNAVGFKEGVRRPQLARSGWQSYPQLAALDYVVARGDHRAPPRDAAVRVDSAGPPWWTDGTAWTLYRVAHPEPVQTSFEARGGGTGGTPIVWNCPRGEALSGVVATTTRGGTLIGSVQPRCRGLRLRDDGRVETHGARTVGPRFGFGGQEGRRVLECPAGEVMVGLYGKGGIYVDHVGVICGVGRLFEDGVAGADGWLAFTMSSEVDGVGGRGGQAFRLECPEDSVPVGLRGGFGAMIDAVGVACGPALGVVDPVPHVTPNEVSPRTPSHVAPARGTVEPAPRGRAPRPMVLEPGGDDDLR